MNIPEHTIQQAAEESSKEMKKVYDMPTYGDLAAYIIARRSLADEKEIATTAGKRNSVEHALVSSGMKMAYSDILDWLSNHGIKV